MKNVADLSYVDLDDNFFWYVYVEGFRLGNSDSFSDGSPAGYNMGRIPAIVDTGTSYIFLPHCMTLLF
jgi:hypothetical protein